MNCKFHWVNPNSWEGWGWWRKKHGGRQDDSGFDFWPIHLAILADSIQYDKNKKLFQDCALNETQMAWLKTSKCHPWFDFHMPIPCQPTILVAYGGGNVSAYRLKTRSFDFSIFWFLNLNFINLDLNLKFSSK